MVENINGKSVTPHTCEYKKVCGTQSFRCYPDCAKCHLLGRETKECVKCIGLSGKKCDFTPLKVITNRRWW